MRKFSIENGATEVLLVRHADAEHPASSATPDPALDMPLCARGHLQARALGERLAHRSLDAVYTSPLRRARETADAIVQRTALPLTEDARLREIELGNTSVFSLHELAEIAIARGGWSHLPGAEDAQAVRSRITASIDDVVAAHPGGRVAVVSHAGTINAYISCLLQLRHEFFFPAGNTSISIVRAYAQERLVVTLNDIAHLETLRRNHAS